MTESTESMLCISSQGIFLESPSLTVCVTMFPFHFFCRPNNEIPNDNWQMSGYFAKASKGSCFFLDWKGFPQKSPRIDYTSFFRDFKGSKGLRSGVDNTMWIWLLPKVIRRRRSSGHLEPLLSPKYASLKLSISGFRQSFLICFTLQKPLWHF